MPTPGVRVEGARQVRRALRGVEDGIDDLKAVHADAAEIVEQRAAAIVPRATGRLAASVRSSGQAAGAVVRAGKKAVPYAGVIHFGWPAHSIEPQPFLYSALDERRDEVIDTYQAGVDKLIDRHGLD